VKLQNSLLFCFCSIQIKISPSTTPQQLLNDFASEREQDVFGDGPLRSLRLGKHHTNTIMQNINFFSTEQAIFLKFCKWVFFVKLNFFDFIF